MSPFYRLVKAGTPSEEYMSASIDKHLAEVRRNINKAHQQQEKYYNMRRQVVHYKVGDWVLLETHPISSAAHKRVAKFSPKYSGPYRVVQIFKGNLRIEDSTGKRRMVNIDQVKKYYQREAEIENESQTDETPSEKLETSWGTSPDQGSWSQVSESETTPERHTRATHPISRSPTDQGSWRQSSEIESTHNQWTRGTHPISESPTRECLDVATTKAKGSRNDYRKRVRPSSTRSSEVRKRKNPRWQKGSKRVISIPHEDQKKRRGQSRVGKHPLSEEEITERRKRAKPQQGQKRSRENTSNRGPGKRNRKGSGSNTNMTQDHPARNTRSARNHRESEQMTPEERNFMIWCSNRHRLRPDSLEGHSGFTLC